MSLDPADGGMSSRKLWFAVITSAFIFAGAALAGIWPMFSPNYDAMVGGLLGALTIYVGGNLGAKWTIGKHTSGSDNVENAASGGEAEEIDQNSRGQKGKLPEGSEQP